MDTETFEVKVISLESAVDRRKKISNLLKGVNLKFEFVDAVDGRKLPASKYYPLAKNEDYWFNRRHIISPSELGCRLSHKKALEDFVNASEAKWLIVLEDDINFKFEINELITRLNFVNENVLHLGGQEGLHNSYRAIKYKIRNSNLKKVLKITSRWLYRTCGYVVDKKAANRLLSVHNEFNFVADDWSFIMRKSNLEILYFDLIQHPLDLNDSSIENER